MVSKLVLIILMFCLGLCTQGYAIITTYEEALHTLGYYIMAALKNKEQERHKALVLIQDRLLIIGIKPDKRMDFYAAVERGDIAAMQACLK